MNIIDIFPTAIGKYKLDRTLTQEEKNYLINLDVKQNKENSVSVNSYILEDEKMQNLKEWINLKLIEYYNSIYEPKYYSSVYITQSWVNYASKGESHHKHSHKNSFLSAVFYIKSNPEYGRIVFHKSDFREIDIEFEYPNKYNGDSYSLSVGSLDLVIFPSNLMHSVELLTTDETRISLALNTFIKGEFGETDRLSKLKIS